MGSSLLIESMVPLTWMISSFPVLLGESALWANLSQWTQVALGLGFVIFVHELGHFLAAKTFGVRCDKFYVGFDVPISIGPIRLPSNLGKFQWGETEYGIGIIPLGGYVKMLGQDDDPRKAEEEAAKLRLGDEEDAPLDPRSYPAKPVWQRMIIISAGVVMNLIFAVILAGVAYWYGLPYEPSVIGGTFAGGPAWKAGIEPGDQILSVGSMDEKLDKLRYDDFAMEVLSHGFEYKDKEIPITVRRGDEVESLEATPTPNYNTRKFYMIGVTSTLTPTLSGESIYPDDSFIDPKSLDLKDGDKIVAVDGQELHVDPRFGEPLGTELTALMQAKWNRPVLLTVERPAAEAGSSPKQHQVEIPAVPAKSIGVGFAMGPVSAIQEGSAAAKSALQVGDVIGKVNGEAISNALELPNKVAGLAGQDVLLEVTRDGTTREITLRAVDQAKFDPLAPLAADLSLAGLGVAYSVRPEVISVSAAGEEAGFAVGDELLEVRWVVENEDAKEALAERFPERWFETLVIDDSFTIPCLYDAMQLMPAESKFLCTVKRDGKVTEGLAATTAYQDNWFWHDRAPRMGRLMDTYYATGLYDAAKLGLWETSRRFTGVLNFLKLLVTGRIGTSGLGGPLRIASAAASEASYGPSRLLIFLTMLSANLAILNFLPIPALDGGHMVFLTAEAIRGKPVSEALQIRLTMVGVLGLLSLMAFVIVKDILWIAS